MILPSEEHPEYMKALEKNNPSKERIIDKDDNWYFKDSTYISNSMLSAYKNGGIKNYDCYLRGELKKESEAFNIGSALHCLILEPQNFSKRFYVFDDTEKIIEISGPNWKEEGKNPRNTKLYKEWYKEEMKALEENPEITLLTKDDIDLVIKMEEALNNIPEVISMIKACQQFEIIYSNEINGKKVKCKVDAIRFGDFIIDIKTTSNYVKDFQSTCYKFDYDRAAAFYTDVVGVKDFYFIVVEKNYPYNVGIFKCGEEFLERGRKKYMDILDELNVFLSNPNFDVDKFYFKQMLF